jgi:hypothetical protein
MTLGQWSGSRLAVVRAIAAAVLAAAAVTGCGTRSSPAATVPLFETPDGAAMISRLEPARSGYGYGFVLLDGSRIDAPPARVLVQTTNGPDALLIWGHDGTGPWVLWLSPTEHLGAGCFGLPQIGYDRGEFITWPEGFALRKAADFTVNGGVGLQTYRDPYPGAYLGGGESPTATFCIDADGEARSVSP